MWATTGITRKLARIDASDPQNIYMTGSIPNNGQLIGLTAGSDGNIWAAYYGVNRLIKIGTGVSGSAADADGDGLTASQELRQGTSDVVADTDNDGLSDFIESQWNLDRNDVFCGIACAYPDPLRQDVYLEIDWMEKPNDYSMKPTVQQLTEVTAGFAARGIKVHTDTGEYGGGNQVPYNSSIWFTSVANEKDFVDYKRGGDGIAAQFDSARDGIWHYMISGDHYQYVDDSNNTITMSSGVANVGGPNLMVAHKRVSDIAAASFPAKDFDTALAGTIVHELGHNLCLTNSSLQAVAPDCHFDGIDNPDFQQPNYQFEEYVSSMNYLYQFDMADYSQNSTNNPDDHDDWSAIRPQDFASFNEAGNGQGQALAKNNSKNKRIKNFKHAVSAKKVDKRSAALLHKHIDRQKLPQ